MLVRSKRAPLHSTQYAELGPGCYNPAVPDFKPKAGNAPFLSTSERGTMGSSSFVPGPGEYETNFSSLKASNRPSPQFLSKQSRLARDTRSNVDVPGPGAYAGDLVKEPAPPQSSKKLHSASGINWVKVATAPSIPSQVQSYGYQEGAHGELVQQPLPVSGFTGVGDDKAGPGHYNPKDNILKHAKGTLAIGKVTGRAEPAISAVPGPGAYNADAVTSSEVFHGGVMARRPLSMFASTTTRRPQMVTMYGPGPGSYKPESSFASLREHLAAHPETFHSFGSSDMRPRGDEQRDGAPGPGTYYVDKSQQPAVAEIKPSPGFASKTDRFFHPTSDACGPGTYASDGGTIVHNVGKQLKGRFGVFGTTSNRFVLHTEEKRPPIGAYDRKENNTAELRRKDKRSPAFRPSGTRDDPSHKTQGANTFYEKKTDWPKPTTQATHFLTSMPRFANTSKSEEVPGPGHYPIVGGTGSGGLQPSGWSKGKRFDTYTTAVPGPGHYNVNATLHKKTFNITIGDSWE